MSLLSNPDLLQTKKILLNQFPFEDFTGKTIPELSCSYHGIEFTIKSRNADFINDLRCFLPIEWQRSQTKNSITILATDPNSMGVVNEDWCNEVSQDCFNNEANTQAIQRDFAAQAESDQVILICENKVGDGFYNFLRWFLSEKLMEINKYVLHASCVLNNKNKALLFLGHSGAGKTTITKLASARKVLGDDMNIVSFINGQLFVEAGAIGGQFSSMIGYGKLMPVEAIYWLVQAENNHQVRLDEISSAQKIVASFANLHWPTLSAKKINQLLSFASMAASTIPLYSLNFRKESSIWDYIDQDFK